MVSIGICDDNETDRSLLMELLKDYKNNYGYDIVLHEYKNPVDILTEPTALDVYFLDILFTNTNGIELGLSIHERNPEAKIVFLSSSKEYAFDSYKVGAVNYLSKPITKDTLEQTLMLIKRNLYFESHIIKTPKGERKIYHKDINYIDIVNRSACYHMIDGTAETTQVLRTNFQQATAFYYASDRNFIFIAPSLVINLKHILYLHKESVTFINGDVAYFPAKHHDEIRAAWIKI